MRTVYKVTVEANIYDDNGDFVRAEVLLEQSSPRPEALLRTAPIEVEDALRDLLPEDDEDDVPAAAAPVAGDPIATLPAPAPKTRKRRTKAEIAADKAREDAAKALPAASVPAAPEVPAAAPAPVVEAQPAAPVVVPPEPVPAESAPAANVAATPLTPGAPAAAPAAPWNPFEQR